MQGKHNPKAMVLEQVLIILLSLKQLISGFPHSDAIDFMASEVLQKLFPNFVFSFKIIMQQILFNFDCK